MFNAVHTPDPSLARVMIFIDGANLFYAARSLNIRIDYVKLLKLVGETADLTGAFFYTGVDPENDREYFFLNRLRYYGYDVITKDLIRRADGSTKANLDTEIALDLVIMALTDEYDTAVLVSGDGDFACAVDRVRGYGKTVKVIGLTRMTSDTLIKAATEFTDLATIQGKIAA